MANQYTNKVVVNGNAIIDITDTTAVAANVENGRYFYTADGAKTPGSLVIQDYYTGSSAPSSSLGNDGDIYLQT